MGYQYKSLLPVQVRTQQLSGLHIQVIRRLINEQKIIFPGKKHCQHDLCALSVAQRLIRTVENICLHMQKFQFPADSPQLIVRLYAFDHFYRITLHILLLYLKRKIVE